MANSMGEEIPTTRADSTNENLPTAPTPQEIFPNSFPSKLFKIIFSHSTLVTLMQLTATSRILRLQVHNFFTSRLSDQAEKYPEIRDSLSRLGWTKDHDHGACDCFRLVAGPGFTWPQLMKRKFFSTVSGRTGEDSVTTVAGKTFFIKSNKEVIFFDSSTENTITKTSPTSLVSFKRSPIVIENLTSYDQVLAFSLKKPMPDGRHAICIYNPATLSKITEIDLIEYDDRIPQDIRNVEVSFIDFAKDTMAIHLDGYGHDGRNILMWKINTKEPEEEGIAFLGRVDPPPNFMQIILSFGTFHLNDRFIAILDDGQVNVLNRTDGALVRQIERVGHGLAAWELEKEDGDHIAFAVTFIQVEGFNMYVGPPKLVFKIYSVTRGQIITVKELVGWPLPSVRYMKWFGPHLVVILEKGNNLSMMSWQPGLASFLPCPLNVEMERRSSPGDGGGAVWAADAADCVHVDYGGITIAHKWNGEWDSNNKVGRYE